MRTSYHQALVHLNLNLGDEYVKVNEANNQSSIVGVGTTFAVYDIHYFDDKMAVDTSISRENSHGFSFESKDEKYLDAFEMFPKLQEDVGIGTWPVGIASTALYVGKKTVESALENVTKAMLLALLDGTSKRTTTVGVGTTGAKKDIFYNALSQAWARDWTLKPWGGSDAFISTHSSVTASSISRTNNVAEITTSGAHGLSTSFDDWGAVVNINTSSFNISTSTYPNGVPIVITDNNTFTYRNTGINTSISSGITGITNITVGWGGTSNNLHTLLL